MRKLLLFVYFLFLVTCTQAQRQFWGTSSAGGEHENGFIFRTDSIGNNLVIVHHFKEAVDGQNISALVLASNNKLYGMAAAGGLNSAGVFASGTFFEYDLNTDQFKVLQHFGPANTDFPNIYMPKGEGQPALTEVKPGILYGLMNQGQRAFSYNIATGAVGQPFEIPNYNGGPSGGVLQNKFNHSLYKASDGFLYASTPTNSVCPVPNPYMGSIIRVNPANNAIAIRYRASCQVESGYSYSGGFAEANGKLYGLTMYGGAYNGGVLYEYTMAANTFAKKVDLNGAPIGSFYPTSLVFAKNGKLYATGHGGGVAEPNLPGGGGVLVEFDLVNNTYATKHNFLLGSSWIQEMGTFPASLVSGANGKLYGTTEFGVFEYNTTSEEARVAGRFNGRGYSPSLIQICRKPAYQYRTVSTLNVCKDQLFEFDLSSENTTSVTWKHNNVIDATQTSATLSFASFSDTDAGTWICTMTNECGSTTSQTITLIYGTPDQPTVTAQGTTTFCEGKSVVLSAPEGFSEYNWSSGKLTREVEVDESGEYSVTVGNGCTSQPSEITKVTVNELPPAPSEIQSLSYEELKAIGTTERYEWRLNGNLLEEQSDVIAITESGLYTVKSVSPEGCASEQSASISFVITDLEKFNKELISVFPNPGKGIINIKLPIHMSGSVGISVFRSDGNLVFDKSLYFQESQTQSLNLSDLSPGAYHLIIRKGTEVIRKKIMIRE